MNDLQKIVVLCVVLGIGIGIGLKSADMIPKDNGAGQIDPPSLELETGPDDTTVDETELPEEGAAQPDPAPVGEDDEEVIPVPEPDPLPEESDEPVACTMDAKICPDGTAVGREGPDCEFAQCPAVVGTLCTPEQKAAELCTLQYDPVCGYESGGVSPETYGNACGACATNEVVSYTAGECGGGGPLQLQM